MIKSILSVSEGGPDAAMSFGLAARVAAQFGASVDALHLDTARGGAARGLAGGDAMPLLMSVDDERLNERGQASQQAYRTLLEGTASASYSVAETAQIETMVAMGRSVDLLVLGRPGSDPENVAPATVEAALFECACPVLIAPPGPGSGPGSRAGPGLESGPFSSAIVAWNGSQQAARAMANALPFLRAAFKITLLVVGNTSQEVNAPYLARHLGRHGIAAQIAAIDPGAVSGRARGRALLEFTHDNHADLLVMGAYGGSQPLSFLGLGGATGKIISSCRVPLLMAR